MSSIGGVPRRINWASGRKRRTKKVVNAYRSSLEFENINAGGKKLSSTSKNKMEYMVYAKFASTKKKSMDEVIDKFRSNFDQSGLGLDEKKAVEMHLKIMKRDWNSVASYEADIHLGEDGKISKGKRVNGQLEGVCAEFDKDGGVKHGDKWERGVLGGNVSVIESDGKRYFGVMEDGKLVKFKFGDKFPNLKGYKGEVKDGVPHGIGKKTHSSGLVEEGKFVDGEINGQGKLTLPKKYTYVGEIKHGKANGRGKITNKKGVVIEGEFKDSCIQVKTKMTYANGDSFEGEFGDDRRNAEGDYKILDGRHYYVNYHKDQAIKVEYIEKGTG
ncbi:MAG: hypothetical protein HRT90_10690, partial [Candidatus Margulisbacteria bacterium]|nr:hypothetical protein [Candidatus Margulisiibacteriota bacterium]